VSFIMDGSLTMVCKNGALKLWDPILYGSSFEVRSNFVWFQILRCFLNCNLL
jgi:hypothetical protein